MKIFSCIILVMITIILVFNAFGIAYSSNNFFGALLQVETGLGSASSWFMNAFNSVKSFVNEWIPDFMSLLEPLKGVVKQLSLIVSDIYKNIKPNLENIFVSIKYDLSHFARSLSFFRKYGLYILNSDWWAKFNFFYKIELSDFIYKDGVYDWEIFEKLYDAYRKGTFTDEFAYIQLSYDDYLEKSFNLINKNYPSDFDIFVISRESISSISKKSLEDIYKRLTAHEMPVLAFKVPKFTTFLNYYDEEDFYYLFSEKDFSVDFMTKYNFSSKCNFSFEYNGSERSVLNMSFFVENGNIDNRIIVSNPIISYVSSINALGFVNELPTVQTGSFDCIFKLQSGNGVTSISGRDLYELYLEQEGLDDSGFASGDEAYPSVYGYFISSDILEYDVYGIFDDFIN